MRAWRVAFVLQLCGARAPRQPQFELFQYDTRPVTLLHNATRAWCAQSRCCEKYTFASTPLRDDDGTVLPTLWARIKALRDLMLSTTSEAVVWVDSDIIFVDERWCPSFGPNKSMVIAQDPYPWNSTVNHGFFALRGDGAGRGRHWPEFLQRLGA